MTQYANNPPSDNTHTMADFVSSSEAFRIARERASVAISLEADMLHVAVFDAREAGLTRTETAIALRVDVSVVARHWPPHHRCDDVPPMWGTPEAWKEARAAVWAHNPHELANDSVPYIWSDDGTTRSVKIRSRGTASLRAGRLAAEDQD